MIDNRQRKLDLLDAIQAGHTVSEMATLIGVSVNHTIVLLGELIAAGQVERLSKGRYVVKVPTVKNTNGIRPFSPNGGSHLAESTSRKVQLPDYMRTRTAVTLFVERSPEEIEGVFRLELCIGGNWIPIPITSDLRLCVGDDVPRWSPTQEVYADVKAFRITQRDGSQSDYPHNPDMPFTVDRKQS